MGSRPPSCGERQWSGLPAIPYVILPGGDGCPGDLGQAGERGQAADKVHKKSQLCRGCEVAAWGGQEARPALYAELPHVRHGHRRVALCAQELTWDCGCYLSNVAA